MSQPGPLDATGPAPAALAGDGQVLDGHTVEAVAPALRPRPRPGPRPRPTPRPRVSSDELAPAAVAPPALIPDGLPVPPPAEPVLTPESPAELELDPNVALAEELAEEIDDDLAALEMAE